MRIRHFHRVTLPILAAASLMLIGITSPTAYGTVKAKTAPAVTLTIGQSAANFTSLVQYVGQYMGIFKKYGIIDSPVIVSGNTIPLIESGTLDVTAIDPSATILGSVASNTPLDIISGMQSREANALVCRQGVGITGGSYPKDMSQLVGKTLEASAPTGADITDLALSIAGAGYSMSQFKIEYVAGGQGDVVAALEAGVIDCAMLEQPTQTELGKSIVYVINFQNGQGPKDVINAPFNCLIATASYVQQHRAVIGHLQEAVTAIDALIANPANASRIARAVAPEFPAISNQVLLALIKKLAPTYKNGQVISRHGFDEDVYEYNYIADHHIGTTVAPLPNVNYSTWVLPLAKSK